MKNNSIIQQIKNGKIANLVVQVLDRCLTCCTSRKGTCTHITPGYMHVECSVHSPATLQPAQRRHPIYCHNSSNRFGIQAVDDSQNELPSSLKSLRNLILQNRLLLKTPHFFTTQTFSVHGSDVFYISTKQSLQGSQNHLLNIKTSSKADLHYKSTLDQRGLQTVTEVKTKI